MSIFKEIKVIELASVLAGPSVGQFFAELGAKVVKIENPNTKGDVTRSWKLPSEDKNSTVSAYFSAANWGKTSICLDIKHEKDLYEIYNLIRNADIVITSYKPGDAEKLKVDYNTLSALNPKLIYGDISGYTGNDKAGYDAIIQAETGFMYMNGQKDSPPTKMPVALIDVLCAHQLKEGILVALLNRERTSKGDFVEVSLFDSAIASLSNQGTNWLVGNKNPERIGSEHPNIVPYGTVFYDSENLPLVLAVGSDKQFQNLCKVLGKEDIALDKKFNTNHQRVINREEIEAILIDAISNFKREELLYQLEFNNVPAGAVNSVKESLSMQDAKRLILEKNNLKGIKNIAFRLKNLDLNLDLEMPPHFNIGKKQLND